jgi:adrenodoxin-NADP+ reductase
MYSGIILAYGATGEKELGLAHEHSLARILSSRQMANWYNGSLDDDLNYDRDLRLEAVKDVSIIGNGNVAMDISRVLLKDPSILEPYDAPSEVINHLKKS